MIRQEQTNFFVLDMLLIQSCPTNKAKRLAQQHPHLVECRGHEVVGFLTLLGGLLPLWPQSRWSATTCFLWPDHL